MGNLQYSANAIEWLKYDTDLGTPLSEARKDDKKLADWTIGGTTILCIVLLILFIVLSWRYLGVGSRWVKDETNWREFVGFLFFVGVLALIWFSIVTAAYVKSKFFHVKQQQ